MRSVVPADWGAASAAPKTLWRLCVVTSQRLCALPDPETTPTALAATTAEPAATSPAAGPPQSPITLPSTWNLLKAMQFLHDQNYLRSRANTPGGDMAEADAAARAAGAPPCVVQALQKVPLEQWSLGYILDIGEPPRLLEAVEDALVGTGGAPCTPPPANTMEVDESGSQASPRHMNVDSSSPGRAAAAPSRSPGSLSSGLPAKKRRRMHSTHE